MADRSGAWTISVCSECNEPECADPVDPVTVSVVALDDVLERLALLREARAFLDTRHGSTGQLARPVNLIERIDAAVGAALDGERDR